MDIVKIVEGNNLRELIENALSDIRYESVKIDNYSLENEHKNTIVTGKLTICYYENVIYHESELDFEVNIGTSKDELVLFDEFEVVIN